MMTVRATTSTSNSRKPYTKNQRRTFWLYKGIGRLKLGRMHRQTGERFVDPTAMSRQIREVSDFCKAFQNLKFMGAWCIISEK